MGMGIKQYKQLIERGEKRKKFGNKVCRCLSGHKHDSKFEATYCNRLLAMHKNHEILGYKIQVPFDIWVHGMYICTHIVDFVVYTRVHELGKADQEAHEAKGVKTAVWSVKRKLFMACYPEIKYVTITKKERVKQCKKLGERRITSALMKALR